MIIGVLVILAACTPKMTATIKNATTIGTPPPEVAQYSKDWPLPDSIQVHVITYT